MAHQCQTRPPSRICGGLRTLCLVLVTLLGSPTAHAAVDVSDLLAELQHMRSKSKDGVIRFDEGAFTRYGTGKKRPYTLYFFLTAKQVMDNPHLALEPLRAEFGLAAQAVARGPEPDSAFFADVVFEDAQKIFHALGVNQVPYIFRLPGNVKAKLTANSLTIPDEDKMTTNNIAHLGKYPWPAETMLDFFSKRGLVAGPVDRPSIYKHPLFPVMVLAALVGVAVTAYGLLKAGFFHHPLPYAVAALVVFWFSVSGGMYNIIRGVPMFGRDPTALLRFIMTGKGNQQGAEGFVVGTGYLIFSSAISLYTFAVPHAKNTSLRTILSYMTVGVATWWFFRLFAIYQGKTGQRPTSYLWR